MNPRYLEFSVPFVNAFRAALTWAIAAELAITVRLFACRHTERRPGLTLLFNVPSSHIAHAAQTQRPLAFVACFCVISKSDAAEGAQTALTSGCTDATFALKQRPTSGNRFCADGGEQAAGAWTQGGRSSYGKRLFGVLQGKALLKPDNEACSQQWQA